MRTPPATSPLILVLAVSALTLGACSKADQAQTQADVQAAADKTAAGAKDVAQSPEMKAVGADVKNAAEDAGAAAKDAAGDAKVAVVKAGAELKQGAADAKADLDKHTDAPR